MNAHDGQYGEELFSQLAGGGAAAWAALVDRVHREAGMLATGRVEDREDADAELLLDLWRRKQEERLSVVQDGGSYIRSALLKRVARIAGRQARETEAARQAHGERSSRCGKQWVRVPQGDRILVRELLSALDQESQCLIVEHVVHGWTVRGLAATKGARRSTVHDRIQRALEFLRQRWEE